MTASARQVVVLIVLFGALAGVVTYQLGMWSQADGTGAASNPLVAANEAAATPPVDDVRLELLKTHAGGFTPPRRDPFRFRDKPAPPPPKVTQAPPRPVGPVAPVPPPAPQVAPITLKFIGVMVTASGARVAVLQDGTSRPPVYGRQGDVIDGRYRLLRVENDSLEIAYLDGTGRRRLTKTGT